MSTEFTQVKLSAAEPETTDTTTTITSPLKTAREKLQLSCASIADKLNLTVAIIEKIEANNFTGIAPIFARGYIRSYAKLVNLNSDLTEQLIDLITEHEPSVNIKKPLGAQTQRICQQKSRKPSQMKPILFAVVALVILAIIVVSLWHNTDEQAEQDQAFVAQDNSANTASTEPTTEPVDEFTLNDDNAGLAATDVDANTLNLADTPDNINNK